MITDEQTPRPTPRTDAAEFWRGSVRCIAVPLAQSLERELAAAETELQAERLRGAELAEALSMTRNQVIAVDGLLQNEIKRGDALAAALKQTRDALGWAHREWMKYQLSPSDQTPILDKAMDDSWEALSAHAAKTNPP